ncbi:helix-turn-helix transcriptional regulator [Streptomyces sp. NPDC087859]|uniref:helix-turn-helix domain-containing protein n=1 Tax=Streptomyces sp. NPDC087859 TaxID=3365812 RepID=UPI003822E68A
MPTLTDRERQILGLLVFAEEYSELARSLGIAERTVKFHVANLRTKLGGLSRLQLCQVALLDLTGLLDTVEICGAHPAR